MVVIPPSNEKKNGCYTRYSYDNVHLGGTTTDATPPGWVGPSVYEEFGTFTHINYNYKNLKY